MARRAAAAAAVAMAVVASGRAAAYTGFTYNPCVPSGSGVGAANKALASGDSTWLCLHINGNQTALFNPKVDVFSAVTLTGSNYALPGGSGYFIDGTGVVTEYEQPTTNSVNCSNTNVETQTLYATFDVTVLGVSSDAPRIFKTIKINPCVYGNGSDIATIPLYTVIIGLSKGVVSTITYDDGCFFCASNGVDCVNTAVDTVRKTLVNDTSDLINCRKSVDYCYPAATATLNATSTDTNYTGVVLPESPCDFKLFIVWTGTDADGQYLTSAGKRFSRFRQYGVASAYQSSLNLISDAQNVANSALNIADGIPGRVAPGFSRDLAAAADADLAAPPVLLTPTAQRFPAPAAAAYSAPLLV